MIRSIDHVLRKLFRLLPLIAPAGLSVAHQFPVEMPVRSNHRKPRRKCVDNRPRHPLPRIDARKKQHKTAAERLHALIKRDTALIDNTVSVFFQKLPEFFFIIRIHRSVYMQDSPSAPCPAVHFRRRPRGCSDPLFSDNPAEHCKYTGFPVLHIRKAVFRQNIQPLEISQNFYVMHP